MPDIIVEESFVLQSLALVESMVRLGQIENKSGEESDLLKKMAYGAVVNGIKKNTPEFTVFQGQGMLLATFFLLLVVPQELQKKKVGDFESIDMKKAEKIASELITNVRCTYKEKKPVLTHFRNALSHARVGWSNENLVIRDVDKKPGYEFEGQFSRSALGEIAEELNKSITAYLKEIGQKRN